MTRNDRRLASIDAFRGLIMLLMIFVDDLPTLKGIPGWLDHAGEMEDRMGLADIVFPAFLFIVGLSIPFALGARKEKGKTKTGSFFHILSRSASLLIMGIFLVNYESYNLKEAVLPVYWWLLIVSAAFFPVWLDYPRDMAVLKKRIFMGAGVLVLVGMAFLFRGDDEGRSVGMQVYWYGILGLIGWCYLLCALSYFVIGDRRWPLTGVFLFFLLFCIADSAGRLHFLDPLRDWVWITSSGALPFLTMGGVVTAVIYRRAAEKNKLLPCLAGLYVAGALMMALGFILRPFWGISKIRATPSWILICIGISLFCFAALAYVMDVRGRRDWYRPLKPAGTSTLTCYVITFIHFSIYHLLGDRWRLPMFFRTGGVGILKSVIFSFLVIFFTGYLERKKFRLSI